jgi:hypothetical protein
MRQRQITVLFIAMCFLALPALAADPLQIESVSARLYLAHSGSLSAQLQEHSCKTRWPRMRLLRSGRALRLGRRGRLVAGYASVLLQTGAGLKAAGA